MTSYQNTNLEMVVYVYGTLHNLLQDDTLVPVMREEVMQSIRYMEIIGSQLSLLSEDMDNSVSLHNMQ